MFVAVYACERFIKNRNVTTVIMAIVPILFGNTIYLISKFVNADLRRYYYRCIHCFSLGVLYASYKDKVDSFLFKYCRPLCLLSIYVAVVCLFYYDEIVMPIAVCILLVILCRYVARQALSVCPCRILAATLLYFIDIGIELLFKKIKNGKKKKITSNT